MLSCVVHPVTVASCPYSCTCISHDSQVIYATLVSAALEVLYHYSNYCPKHPHSLKALYLPSSITSRFKQAANLGADRHSTSDCDDGGNDPSHEGDYDDYYYGENS